MPLAIEEAQRFDIWNPDVLELHVSFAAGMQLQSNASVGSARLGIGKIHHLNAIKPRTVTVPDHLKK